jgi:hypothetical protein
VVTAACAAVATAQRPGRGFLFSQIFRSEGAYLVRDVPLLEGALTSSPPAFILSGSPTQTSTRFYS